MRGIASANDATENGVKLFLSSLGTDFLNPQTGDRLVV